MVILSVGGYFLGRQQVIQNPTEAVAKPLGLPDGAVKFLNLLITHESFIANISIKVTLNGVLKSVDPDKTWAIEKKGETAIIANESGEPVEYFIKNGDARQKGNVQAITVGDRVSITTSIDAKTGQTTVKSVTKLISKASVPATPSASPGK